ncbi:MAG: extracellular solute-binding protein [Phycisphaerales bacterium]|nr:extracellular solute-binding protein [Phycisphaerales bacterium]
MALVRQLKKWSSRILVVASSVLVIWAFGRVGLRAISSGNEEGKTVITVMHWSGGGGQQEDAIVEDSIREFEKRNPSIQINRINPGDTGQYFTKLQTMMASGHPPDIFYMDYSRIPNFVTADQLQPLSSFAEQDSEMSFDDFFPATLNAFRWDPGSTPTPGTGELYGIPKDFTTVGFYWNKDLFARAGVPAPTADWTWDDFANAARKVGALEDCTGAEFVTWPFILRTYLWTHGTDVALDNDWANLQLDAPEFVSALAKLRGWRFDEEHTLAKAQAEGIDPASLFFTGKIGMVGPFGRWVVPSFRSIETFDWDFAVLPRGSEQANVIATVGWSMSNQSKHKDEAWEVLKWLTGEESQASQSKLGLAIPTRIKVAHSDAFTDDQLPENDKGYLEAAEYARVPFWPTDPAFADQFSRQMDLSLRTGRSIDDSISGFQGWWERRQANAKPLDSFPKTPWGFIWIGIIVCVVVWLILVRPKLTQGHALVSPWLIGFVVFLAIPIIVSLVLAMSAWSGLGPLDTARFVGFDNFSQLLADDPTFKTSLVVTLYYAALAVPGSQIVALIGALLLNASLRGINFFRGAWYLPSVLAGVGIAVLWQWVFRSDGGLMNEALSPIFALFGGSPPEWFNKDASWAGPPAFALMSFWVTGGSMMIYLAGLKNIPKSLYEAADIDGASTTRTFFAVTLPMLSPVILFNLIMAIIGSFQVFTQAFVMTGGGPGDSTRFYVLYLYNLAFDYYEMGYASAMAWILLLIVLALTIVIMKMSKKHVYYEAMNS